MPLKFSGVLCASLLTITLSVAAHATELILDFNKVQMRSQQLAPGVYAHLPADSAELNAKGGVAGTSGGLIVGTRGAMLIETMLNRRLFDQVEDLSLCHVPLRIVRACCQWKRDDLSRLCVMARRWHGRDTSLAAQARQCLVDDDARQPCRQRRIAAEAGETGEGTQIGFLQNVFRFAVGSTF